MIIIVIVICIIVIIIIGSDRLPAPQRRGRRRRGLADPQRHHAGDLLMICLSCLFVSNRRLRCSISYASSDLGLEVNKVKQIRNGIMQAIC